MRGIDLVRAELARLLEFDRLELEAGYRLLDDGQMMIASIHHVPGVSGAMIEWWLGRRKTDEEFRMWHPIEHVRVRYDEDRGVTVPTHLVNGEELQARVQRRTANDYLDVSKFPARGVSAAVCSRGGPADREVWATHLIHLCRDTDYGCEVRTRMFIGDLDPAPPEPVRALVLRGILGEERSRWFMRHESEEYVYLARFLPELYAQEGVA